jgi:hypothetical protein
VRCSLLTKECIFPSGAVNVRSHTKASVVNKLMRNQRALPHDESTLRSSNHNVNDNGTKDPLSMNASSPLSNVVNVHSAKRSNGECLFSTAITLIRQPTENLVSGFTVPFNIDSVCLAATFGVSRGFLNPEEMMNQQEQSVRACNSLFIISWHGRLIEYVLEPIPGNLFITYENHCLNMTLSIELDTSKHGARVTLETPLALKAMPKAQWLLQR